MSRNGVNPPQISRKTSQKEALCSIKVAASLIKIINKNNDLYKKWQKYPSQRKHS
jgi:hypothetical protein